MLRSPARREPETAQPNEVAASGSVEPAPAPSAPAPSPASAPAEERQPVERDLVITVLEPGGGPMAGRVVLARDGAGLAVEACDAGGSARFAAHPGPLEVLALIGTWVRGRWSLEDGIGAHTFVLPETSQARGILLIDGAPPERRVVLVWSTDPAYRAVEEAPAFVFESFRWPGQRGGPTFAVETDVDGRFRVPGLTEDWNGRIALPAEYQTLTGEGSFEVPGGAAGLVLQATWRPAIRGRAISAATGMPVAEAAARHEATCADSEFSGSVETEADGRFRIPILCGSVEAFRLRLTAPGLASSAVVLGAVPEEGIDLGDVLLQPSLSASLRVVDDRGAPVEGAFAVLGRNPLDSSGFSDSEGRLDLPFIAAETDALVIHALGRRPADVAVTAALPERAEVRLERVHVLQVEIAGPAAGAAGAKLVLSTKAVDAFELPDADPPESFQAELGASTAMQRTRGSAGLRYVYPCRERITIVGLRGGTLVDLEVFGTDGVSLKGPVDVRIGERGVQIVRIDAQGQALVVPLLVTDEAGEPLFQVQVHGPGAVAALARTRLDGTAEVRGVFSSGTTLTLRKSGYVSQELVLSDPAAPLTGGRHHVMLQTGASFRVAVQTEAGTAADVEWVEVQHEGRKVGSARRIDSGTFEIDGAPARPLLVRVGVGGSVFELPISGPVDTTISVPAYTSVEVTWSGTELSSERWYVLDLEPIAAARSGLRRAARGEEWTRGVTLPAVFPGTYRACLVDPDGRSPSGTVVESELGCADLTVGSELAKLTLADG